MLSLSDELEATLLK